MAVIGVKDVVLFDEVAREEEGEPRFDAETIETLKMIMQSGQYTRDNLELTSQYSTHLGENIVLTSLLRCAVVSRINCA